MTSSPIYSKHKVGIHFFLSSCNSLAYIGSSVSDPFFGNVDLDPGTQKNRDKLAYKSTKIIKI